MNYSRKHYRKTFKDTARNANKSDRRAASQFAREALLDHELVHDRGPQSRVISFASLCC